MIKLTLIGLGAGGCKAAITALEKGILPTEYIKLINTTNKDVPDEYDEDTIFYKFSNLDGCGKESLSGKNEMTNALINGDIDITKIIPEDTDQVVLVTTTEGGTGCGATPVLANELISYGYPVHVYALIGFSDDIRGMNNTLRFFREINPNVILHTIKNEEFLDYTDSYYNAEQKANNEFVNQIKILSGQKYVSSIQNIDGRDMEKITTLRGYMNIQHIDLSSVKSTDTFNKVVQESFDSLLCMEFDKSAKKLAVFINSNTKIRDSVDDKFEVIKRYVGNPTEIFRHIQFEEDENYMDIIISGMNMPRKEIVTLSNRYMELKNASNNDIEVLDDIFNDIDLDDDFNVNIKTRKKTVKVNVNK